MAGLDPELAAVMTGDTDARPAPPTDTQATRRGADLGRLARGGVLNLAGAAASALLNVAFVVVLARAVPQTATGVFFAATSVFVVTYTIARLGAGTGVVYFIARLRALGEPERLEACRRAALRPVLALSVVLGAGLVVAAPWLADRIVGDGSSAAATALRVLGVFIPFAALSDVCLAATRGFGVVRALVLVEKVARPLAQLSLLGLVILVGRRGPDVLATAWVLPYLPAALIALIWSDRLLRQAERAAGVAGESAAVDGLSREFWRFTAPRSVSSVVQVALQRLDIVLVAALRGPVEAAVYGAVTRFLVVGQLGSQAISVTVQPKLSALLAHDDRAEVNRVYRASTGWLVLVTWPVYLLSAVFADEVVRLLGRGYEAGSVVVVVLALTMLVATGSGMVDMVLAMAGRTTWTLANSLLALAVNVGLNLLLIPRLGILGAALAWTAAIVVNNLVPLAQVGAVLRLHPFGRETLMAMALAATCFGVLPGITRLLAGETTGALLVGCGLGALGYAAGLWLLRGPLALDGLRRGR